MVKLQAQFDIHYAQKEESTSTYVSTIDKHLLTMNQNTSPNTLALYFKGLFLYKYNERNI